MDAPIEAFFFSIETMMTIGYGAPQNDVYFGQCGVVLFLISSQTVLGVILNTICLGNVNGRILTPLLATTSVLTSLH
jgi:hypothetical protein